ncbi:MAG: hypothetical protein WCS42_23735, partial [Verrucomicrobiota bacterium]
GVIQPALIGEHCALGHGRPDAGQQCQQDNKVENDSFNEQPSCHVFSSRSTKKNAPRRISHPLNELAFTQLADERPLEMLKRK